LNIEIIAYYYDERMKSGTILYKISGNFNTTYTGNFASTIPRWETYPANSSSKNYLTIPSINFDQNTDTICINLKKGIVKFNIKETNWTLYEYE
jgi:hypothetical protein